MFADMWPGFADGIRTDCDGKVRSSVGWAQPGTDGVNCLTTDGELVGRTVLTDLWKTCNSARSRGIGLS